MEHFAIIRSIQQMFYNVTYTRSFPILFLKSISHLQVNAQRKCFLLLERFTSTLFLGYSEYLLTNGELLNQSRVRNGKVQEKRQQLCTPTRKRTQKRAAAARPRLQSKQNAELSRFPATADNVSLPTPRPKVPTPGLSQNQEPKRGVYPLFWAKKPPGQILSRYITGA